MSDLNRQSELKRTSDQLALTDRVAAARRLVDTPAFCRGYQLIPWLGP